MSGGEKKGGLVRMCTGIAGLVLRDRQMRRQVMFYGMLGVVVQIAVGIAFFEAYLMERPVLFGLYWLSCLAGVLFLMMMSLYDFVVVRQEARIRERELREELRRQMEGDDHA